MELTASNAPTAAGRTPWPQHALVHAVFFAMGAELFLVPPLLGLIARDFGVGEASAAWVISGYVLGYAVSSPLLAALTEGLSPRRVILAGVAIFALGDLGCALAPTLPVLVAAHAVSGIGGGLAAPAIWALLGETAAAHQKGRAISVGAALYAGGQIVGVPLGSLLAAATGWRLPFVVIAGWLAISWLAIAVRLRDPAGAARPRRTRGAAIRASLGLWRYRDFLGTLAATTLTQAARIGAYSYVGVIFGQRYGFGLAALGALGAAVGAGSMSGSLLAGPVIDRWRTTGRPLAAPLIGWAVLLAAAIVGTLAVDAVVPAVLGLLIWCAAGGACYSTAQAMLGITFNDHRAAAVSWNNASMNAGVAVGTALLGTLALGSAGFIAAAAGLAGLGALVAGWLTLLSVRGGRARGEAAGTVR
ncbi:MFS transporter [Enemella evansiae]|uniref:MFS transporter n=1 Tax=Enemella evansiae TaxID=2016499 RepID=UPI000B97AAAC|nr:MFS transporter [Enemella evansiae]OYO00360.1 MFS transporter [Enemella evansiae]OYO03650.1 MFS transporter [Enemella evansiae]PFG68416.1 DHA1 family inner membrane transport protein [Propionibacteriaceae bacterium ES.041]